MIKKILITMFVWFENFYQLWFTDDESFDSSWMDLKSWEMTR